MAKPIQYYKVKKNNNKTEKKRKEKPVPLVFFTSLFLLRFLIYLELMIVFYSLCSISNIFLTITTPFFQ